MGHIKLWESILDCPKVHRLSDRAFRIWAKLLVTALRNGGRNGELPLLETLEFRMRTPGADIALAIEEMHRCGLVDPCPDNPIGGMPWRIHDWDEWQQSKDPTAAVRQARWREKNALRNALRNGVTHAQHNDMELKKEEGKKNTPHKPPKGGDVSSFVIPDWIPRKDWDDWISGRKKKPTLRALELAAEKLAKLRAAGNDPGEVLRRSVMSGWTGLFEISRPAMNKGENNGKTAVQQRPDETMAVLKRPDLPRTAATEQVHQMWDRLEEDQRRKVATR